MAIPYHENCLLKLFPWGILNVGYQPFATLHIHFASPFTYTIQSEELSIQELGVQASLVSSPSPAHQHHPCRIFLGFHSKL